VDLCSVPVHSVHLLLKTTGSLNPFLFIRGLSCPRIVHKSLTQTILKLTICLNFLTTSFLYLLVTLAFLKSLGQVLAWKSGIKMPLMPYRVHLPSANYSAKWSGQVWQPCSDGNGRLARFFIIRAPNSHYMHSQQQADTPCQASSNSKNMCQMANTICSGLSHSSIWAALPSKNISQCFFQGCLARF
jgi:hypothetical protein